MPSLARKSTRRGGHLTVAASAPTPVAGPVAALRTDLAGIVHVLTCGSVDDGKSTLIGRLLWDASDLPDDSRATIERSADADGVPDVSLLVDGLMAEREQGITIDIAWRYVDAGARRIVVIDSPGHEQYTRNMASGASHADVAVMLVDARQGVKPQTRRHAAILDLVGVRHVILAVNKMDLVGWDETWYRAIEADFAALAQTFAFSGARAIPISARLGDNVAWRSRRMAWYAGPSLVERLDTVPPRLDAADSTFRLPVQMALRAGDFRGLAGTLAAGRIRVGETVADALTGRIARVERIVTMAGDLDEAVSGAAVVLELDADLDISRGAVLAMPGEEPSVATALEARLVWLADAPWQRQQRLLLRTSTDLVPVEGLTVTSRLDLETLQQAPGTGCDTNDIVAAELRLARPAALDAFDAHPSTGSIALVDALTGATVAGGVVGAIRSGRPAAGRPRYRLTREMLAAELCKGLGPHDPEFQRRARAAAALIEEAGIAVTIEGLD